MPAAKVSPEIKEKMFAMHWENKSSADIALQLGLPLSYVRNVLWKRPKKAKNPPTPKKPRKVNPGFEPKLSDDQVREIRALRRQQPPPSVTKVAEQFGITTSLVLKICKFVRRASAGGMVPRVTFTRTGTGEPETVGLAGEIARTWVRCDELAKKLKVLPVHLNPRAFPPTTGTVNARLSTMCCTAR